MRKSKRLEDYGVDTFEASSGGGGDGKYTLAWFDDASDALAFARTKAAKPQYGDAELCDSVYVYDHAEQRYVMADQRPSAGGTDA